MIEGEFRDGHPRVLLKLNGAAGPLSITFIVDTGFEGGLALPARLARQLGGSPVGITDRALANGVIVKVPVLEIVVAWDGEQLNTELLVMEGNPLMGTEFLTDHLVSVEVMTDGAVTIEPL